MKKLIPLLMLFLFVRAEAAAQSLFMSCDLVSELLVPRYGHTMLYYEQGDFSQEFFIAGGYDNGGALASAEIGGELFEMNVAHADHTSEKLLDGRFLVIGGWNGFTNLSIIEAFDPQNMSFSMVADLEIPRSFHRSVLLNDGRVLITGGFDGSVNLSSCEIFNPETNSIESAASMNFPRSSHTCTLMPDGKVIVTGGFNPDNGFQQTACEIYDPATNTWENIAQLNSGRDNHAAAKINWDGEEFLVVSGGRFYNGDLNLFEGQSTFEIYDSEANTWTLISPEFSQPMSYHNMHAYEGIFSSTLCIPGSIGNSGIDIQRTYFGRLDMWFEGALDTPVTSQNPSSEFFADTQVVIPGYLYASATAPHVQDNWYDEIYYSGGLKDDGISTDLALCNVHFLSVPEVVLAPLKIYPTPAEDMATVEWGTPTDYQLEVFDTNGKLVFTQKGRAEKAQVPKLPSGTYIASVKLGENTLSSTLLFH